MKVTFLDVLDRAHTGPVVDKKNWELKIFPGKIREKLEKYGLKGVCDPENPVNTDDGLANDFWKAGFELAVETGMYCSDTKRVINFTEDELKTVLAEAPSELQLGAGANRVTMKARKPEDKTRPRAIMAPLGLEISEELYIPLMQSIAQYRVIDIIAGGVPATILGRRPRARTPYETLLGAYEAALIKEALRRANRVGMPVQGPEASPTEYGQLGGLGMPEGFNPTLTVAIPLLVNPLVTSYQLLHKTAHALTCGAMIKPGYHSMIGGYAGSPEGAALEAIAAFILHMATHMGTYGDVATLDLRYLGNCGREALWAQSISRQAQTLNTHAIITGVVTQTAGPCTDMLLYETAAFEICDAASGCASGFGTRPTGCRFPDYASGLENRFCAEVVKASAGLRRGEACELVKALLPRYEDRLRRPPKGLSFPQCTDLKTLQPTPEWQAIYQKVWKELENLGLQKP
ncbi:monomethylamine:corrinoid methyltransferase [Candidatus Hecatella orcuttiae]|uniref:monomethylamine:corrinoid methyltransferase n=1 Tax=Candidatus Hecatella orcuttiae TaxID=1935119 RepID=UPI0028680FB7|nr:monomethylamine:corrinoid methyltransferase [Candidatus Hecatella orcuttiae]